jgi:glycosyltransferase involved in cell wall biosynthesis
MKTPELSVVVLCYGAGNTVTSSAQQIVQILEAAIPEYELILVANYSRADDPTPALVSEIAAHNSRVRFSALKKQGMFGWDMKTGFALATGNYIAVIDGDGQNPFEDIVRVYEAIKSAHADVVKTYRIKRGDDTWRVIVSYIYNFLFLLLFPGVHARDINSKPKIFSREAFDKLTLVSDDWFIDAEMMIQARRYKYKIVEVPTVFNKLVGRRSFVKTSSLVEFLKNLIFFRIREFCIH